MIISFADLLAKLQANQTCVAAAVVWPDQVTIDSALEAASLNIIRPVFFGDEVEIKKLLPTQSQAEFVICHCDTPEIAAVNAVTQAASGEVALLVKGNLMTRTLLKAVVQPDLGLRQGQLMSHVAFVELPGHPQLLAVTDGGMVEQPTLEQKKSILHNAIQLLHNLGYDEPRVAILAATETVNPKSSVTVEADELAKLANSGVFGACVAAGPISFDLAFSPENAIHKHYEGAIQGDADLMLAPDMTAGNILTKGMILASGGKMAGVVVGAKVPIVINSRASSLAEKLNAIALAALYGGKK